MKETLIDPTDVMRNALFAGGWYDAYWCNEGAATRRHPPDGVARQLCDAIGAVHARGLAWLGRPVTSGAVHLRANDLVVASKS
jgi:hypothetical protein